MKISPDVTYTVKTPVPELSELVQKQLNKLGFAWKSGGTEVLHTSRPYICFRVRSNPGELVLTHVQDENWMKEQIIQGQYTEVSIEDIFTIEVPKISASLKVGILEDYPITLEGHGVRAGCQFIKREDFEKLMETAKNYYAEVDKKD